MISFQQYSARTLESARVCTGRRSRFTPNFVTLQDYHVILLCQEESQCWVFDLDTTLPFPCSFEQYAKEALGSETFLRSEFHR